MVDPIANAQALALILTFDFKVFFLIYTRQKSFIKEPFLSSSL